MHKTLLSVRDRNPYDFLDAMMYISEHLLMRQIVVLLTKKLFTMFMIIDCDSIVGILLSRKYYKIN